jgi:hypothetical protein
LEVSRFVEPVVKLTGTLAGTASFFSSMKDLEGAFGQVAKEQDIDRLFGWGVVWKSGLSLWNHAEITFRASPESLMLSSADVVDGWELLNFDNSDYPLRIRQTAGQLVQLSIRRIAAARRDVSQLAII